MIQGHTETQDGDLVKGVNDSLYNFPALLFKYIVHTAKGISPLFAKALAGLIALLTPTVLCLY